MRRPWNPPTPEQDARIQLRSDILMILILGSIALGIIVNAPDALASIATILTL